MSGELVRYMVKSRNELVPMEDEQLLISYRPYHNTEKWLEYRFSEWNTWKAWFAFLLVLGFFWMGGPEHVLSFLNSLTATPVDVGTVTSSSAGFTETSMVAVGGGVLSQATAGTLGGFTSAKVVEWFAILAAISVAGAVAVVARKPTHLLLTDRGIAWEWRRTLMNFGQMVPWSEITHIGVTWPKDRTSPSDCLLTFSTGKNPKAMQVKLGGIATTAERERFLQCLNDWAPHVSKDAEIFDVLTPPPDHSYTELWMQALSAPPKRERLAPLMYGATLGDGSYSVVEQLGVGGQGTAYLTTTKDGEKVVLKEFILPVFVDINIRRQALERMQNEVEMLKRLDNDRIVKLKDFFIEDHRGYLVLELIDGNSLRTIVSRQGKMTEPAVVSLMHQMCDMLEYLHGLSPPVVHRDFTPDNLILGTDGVLKLVDFNVAQQTEVTATGTVVGKHAYIPPEQFRGKPTSQSDIYAMGASVYYLLVGEDPEPITSSHPKEQIDAVSGGLDIIVARATALDTTYRYKSATEIREELSAMLQAAP